MNTITFRDNFTKLRVNICDIDWDTDGEGVKLPKEMEYVFDKDDLIHHKILKPTEDGKLLLDEENLGEELEDMLSDDFGFCHNSFSISYTTLKR